MESATKCSKFTGFLPGTPILYDCFLPKFSTKAGIHILSHFHADHYTGLCDNWSNSVIYCSKITKKLLLNKFSINPDLVVGLPYNVVHTIPLINDANGEEQITIELINANHCAGSAMILLKGYFGTFFLSGDFRYSTAMGEMLMKRGIQNENIDYLVLDCTFSEPFWNFPTQSDAIRQIFQLIENNPTADIYLECEMLGTEPIIVCIAKKYNTLIHVDQVKYDQTKGLNAIMKHLTLDPAASRFHICPRKSFSSLQIQRSGRTVLLPFEKSRPATTTPTTPNNNILIKPSVLWFGTQRNHIPDLRQFHKTPYSSKDAWHVLFSIHSSYQEMLDYVKIIKPKSVIPWTECEISTLELMKTFCASGELPMLNIPPRILSRYSYLQTHVTNTANEISTQINNITTGINNLNTPSIGLDCWSPSPPPSPLMPTSDQNCTEEEVEILECGTLKRKFSAVDFGKEESVNQCKKQRTMW